MEVTTLSEHLDDKTIKGMFKRAGISDYTKRPDGKYDILEVPEKTHPHKASVSGTIRLNAQKDPWVQGGKLTVQFGKILCKANFEARNMGLTSFEGFPESIPGYLDVTHNPITSFEGCPSVVEGTFNATLLSVTSLVGIADHIIQAEKFFFTEKKIKEGGIGLLSIKGLRDIPDHSEPFQIIHQYLSKPDDIFDCQSELIDKNLEEFAQP